MLWLDLTKGIDEMDRYEFIDEVVVDDIKVLQDRIAELEERGSVLANLVFRFFGEDIPKDNTVQCAIDMMPENQSEIRRSVINGFLYGFRYEFKGELTLDRLDDFSDEKRIDHD